MSIYDRFIVVDEQKGTFEAPSYLAASGVRTVWKYSIPILDKFELELPKGARFLHVSPQGGLGQMWFEIPNTRAETSKRGFFVHGTGDWLPDGYAYRGTFMFDRPDDSPAVWHLYERVGVDPFPGIEPITGDPIESPGV